VFALHFGRQLLSFAEGTQLTDWIEQLDDKLTAAKTPLTAEREARIAQRLVFWSEPYRAYGAADEALDAVLDGLLNDRLLNLRYASRGGARDWQRVEPLALVIYRRALYLMARLFWSDEVLRLAVDRIEHAECTKIPFPYPTDFDPRAELERSFGIFAGEHGPQRVRIRFAPRVADLVQSRTWHPTATVSVEDSGAAVLEMVAGGVELVRLVLEWGPVAEVLEPPWLRERVRQELTDALAQYTT
jgi:predicted DNA-binding transcriptional regulator YafY